MRVCAYIHCTVVSHEVKNLNIEINIRMSQRNSNYIQNEIPYLIDLVIKMEININKSD